ncbi:Transcriptional regulatory protein YycF [Actinomadura rubteroloni]|uniref:Transcriptional regulatory protein YycF n=1 Tax=Actinomadura rubteroloni TaxID=1926885 RepID=A0A2P4UFZ4_9ACTN|nr:response regulator transcription factor [Actinomadura rubteroloni]POM23951.1 Transcriptional regulatory protein YycF [Actinomadura rubteroloni]
MTGGAEHAGLVLVAEHDPAVAELERRYLAREGFEVEIERDPERAAGRTARARPAAVVLDLSVSPAPAALLRRVADAADAAPVLAVTGPSDGPGDLGVHRLTRPFGPRTLVAAVLAALRRDDGTAPLRAGALVLDPAARTAGIGERPVALTATEFDLLRFLAGSPGRVFTREQLLAGAWGPASSSGSRTVDVHIAQLRAKLGDGGSIRTVRGVGYVLDA